MSISAGERYFIVRLAPFCSTSDMVELSCVAISVQNVYGMGPISDGAKPEGLFGREQSLKHPSFTGLRIWTLIILVHPD